MLKLYNTLTRKKEIFKPLKKNKAGFYACGPTVYWYVHLGNLRTYIFEDILKRVLGYNGYKVKHIINITDVGHLTSDADTGEDKMEVGAQREKKTAWQIADFYANAFKKDLQKLNIQSPDFWPKATDHIKEQIKLIKLLEKKGFTYKISDGIYFDTSKIKDYGKLAGLKKRKLRPGARVEIVAGKKNPSDFALWKFSPREVKRQMEWQSPWGKGFPGWHTECLAMAIKYLGLPFDIHAGGIDHIPIHHTNEIAQARALYQKDPAKFWLHAEFLLLPEGRMGKSEGNIIILNDLIKRGFYPLAYRYLCLETHYRSKLTFCWESLKAAQNGLNNLYEKTLELKQSQGLIRGSAKKYKKEFLNYINDDLNTPKALALMWKLIKNNKATYGLLLDFDKVFGLDLKKIKKLKIPLKIKKLAEQRENYRQQKNWQKADKIRKEIEKLGYKIEDTGNGSIVKKF